MTGTEGFQPRFAAFLADTPDLLPEGTTRNVQFMEWVRARWGEWRAETGKTAATPLSEADHVAFDAWLAARVAS